MEHDASMVCGRVLLVVRGLEIVEQVELEMIDERGIDFVSVLRIGRGGGLILSFEPSSTMPDGVTTRPPALAVNRSGSVEASSPISLCNAPTTNSRMEIVEPSAKNGFTRRSVSTPSNLRSVDRAVWIGGDAAVLHTLAGQLQGDWLLSLLRLGDRQIARGSQISGDLIRQHFLQAQGRRDGGESRLSGRVTTFPPAPADPRGRP